jgi:outer membrane protein assembly factor BamB
MAAPVIGPDGTIYVGALDGRVYAFTPDGALKWSYATGARIEYASAALSAAGVLYQNTSTGIYALNAADGAFRWKNADCGGANAPVIGTDGTVYSAGGTSKRLCAIKPDGTVKWTYRMSNVTSRSAPAIAPSGVIYVGSYDRNLYAVNPDGTLRWTHATGDLVLSSPAIGADGTVYVGAADGLLYAINPNGSRKWSYRIGSVSSPVIAADGTIYAAGGGYLRALAPNGSSRWSYFIGNQGDSSPAIGANGVVYVGSVDPRLYAIAPNGSSVWTYTTSGAVISSPAIGADGTLYFGSSGGRFYALAGGPVLTPTPTRTPSATPTPTSTPSATPTPTSTAGVNGTRLYLYPSATTRDVNELFTLELWANTGGVAADTVDAYLNFDPTYLEVVDAAGNPASAIELNTAVFSSATLNTVFNLAGQINFSASRYETPYLVGVFKAATIRFRPKAAVDSTSVAFVRAGARWSDLLRAGESLHPALTGGTVTIGGTGIALSGRVALERRGSAGDPRWITPLYRIDDGATTGGVTVYRAGTNSVLGSYATTTDANGRFSMTLTGLAAGIYDVRVKGANTLSNRRANVSLPSATEINFGTLLVGDSTGNDAVNGADVSYMIPSFLLDATNPAFRPYADTNNDSVINGADVSALIPNFLRQGPIPVAGYAPGGWVSTGPRTGPGSEASLAFVPTSRATQVGDTFTLDVVADTGTGFADTVDAYVNFDPAYLEVVDATGNLATSVELNTVVFSSATFNAVNNITGQINFSASKYESPYLTGSFTAATIRFRAKAAVASTDVVYVQNGARMSDLLQFGESLNPAISNGSVAISPSATSRQMYLPLILPNR